MTGTAITETKTTHPADDSPRWIVAGEHGQVIYDVLGNHLALLPAAGEIDSVMGSTLAKVGDHAQSGDDIGVFLLMQGLYFSELAPLRVDGPTNWDRRCQKCGATSGLILLPGNPLTGAGRAHECVDGCKSVTR
jgi:hypothetical protein